MLSMFLILPGIYMAIEHSLLIFSGNQYEGKVHSIHNKKISKTTGKGSREHSSKYPKIEFTDINGKKNIIKTVNKTFIFKEYEMGEQVSVYYDSTSNQLIVNDFFSLWSQALSLIVLGGLICYFGRNLKPI